MTPLSIPLVSFHHHNFKEFFSYPREKIFGENTSRGRKRNFVPAIEYFQLSTRTCNYFL